MSFAFRTVKVAHWRALALAAVFTAVPALASADEGGVSFWLPGQYASLIAAPQQPGWAFGSIFIHENLDADGAVAAARQATVGNLPLNVDINLAADLDGQLDILL